MIANDQICSFYIDFITDILEYAKQVLLFN